MEHKQYPHINMLVETLVATHTHESLVKQVDNYHRVIQVASDERHVYIVPQYKKGEQWTNYKHAGSIRYWVRVSSGYYQAQAAIAFIQSSLLAR